MQEYRRLLYVGLTRARDRLYVCGWQTLRPPPQACWHTLCRAGLGEYALPFDFDTKALIGEEYGWAGEGLRIESPQIAPPERAPAGAAAPVDAAAARLGEAAAAARARSAAAVVPVAAERRRAARPCRR